MVKKNSFLLIFLLFSTGAFPQYKLYETGLKKYMDQEYPSSIKLLSDFLNSSLRDKKFDLDAYYYRGLAYYKTELYQNAINDFEETILLNHDNKGNIYWFMAKCQDKLCAPKESLNDYTNAIKELGADKKIKAKLLYERSQVYSKAGNIELAYEDLKNGAALNPENPEIKKELDKLEKRALANRNTSLELTQEKNNSNTKPELNAEKKQADIVQQQPVVQKPVPVSNAQTIADSYREEKRYALVIGNSKYPKEIGVLKNPVNDATDIANELKNSNFDVQLLTDATYGQIRAAMLEFKEKVDAGDRDKTVALFYYAGHGLHHEDENYLVPIDAAIQYEDDIARYCFPVQRMVLANMERSNARMNIVILDACRNNPFPALTRSLDSQGLSEMRRARGSFIAYATAPGSVASDGLGRNGLYTQELLKAMRKPGRTIEQVFKEVRQNVLRMSGDKQNTWDSSNIIGEFYFKFE